MQRVATAEAVNAEASCSQRSGLERHACRVVRAMARALDEDTLHTLVQLALLQAIFAEAPAAALLRLPSCKTRGRLAALVRIGLLQARSVGGADGFAMWEMHACVRGAACRLSRSLGLSHSMSW